MKTFIVAESRAAIEQNQGTEIVASDWGEARDKAEALSVPCRPRHNQAFGLSDEGLYTISDGTEFQDMYCEFVQPAVISGLGEEEEALL